MELITPFRVTVAMDTLVVQVLRDHLVKMELQGLPAILESLVFLEVLE